MRTIAAALSVALWTSSALAEECAKLEKQQELNECAVRELQRYDHTLGEMYKDITNRLQERPEAISDLDLAQEAWTVYRDAECRFASSGSAGGSVNSFAVAQCKEELTRARITRLSAYLRCQEGDVTCPVPSKQ
jgi:uncharacterized protein YecT (DUF1311 family)